MLSAILRRSTFAAHKVRHWAGTPQRCWTLVSTRTSNGDSSFLRTCWNSTSRLPFPDRGNGQEKPLPVLGSRRTELFQRTQTHAVQFLVRNQHFHSSAVKLKKRPKAEPPPTELHPLDYEMKDLWKSPKPALYLWFAGLVPFVAPPLFIAMTENYYPELVYAQLAYGASILSFLGGARWGFALPENSPAKPDWLNLTNSVVPSLYAWITILMSGSIVPAIISLILGFGIAIHYDLSLLPTYPSWFKALRTLLTTVAFFSMLGTLFVIAAYSEEKI